MKAHEMAKKLGINMKALNDLLGLNAVKSPNQELTSSQESTLESSIMFPASKTFAEVPQGHAGKEPQSSSTIICMGVDKPEKTTYCIRVLIEDGQVSLSEIIEKKRLPSLAQAYAHIDYMLSKIEMGDIK